MDRKVRIAQYGCGHMAGPTMKYVYDHGGEVVCAFARTDRVAGKDIGEVIGSEDKGVRISYSKDARKVFEETKPDVCIVETMSLLPDCEDIFLLCAEMGINVITTCEEAFYPWNSRYKMTKKIDELAKKNNCTLVGTGAQDKLKAKKLKKKAQTVKREKAVTVKGPCGKVRYTLAGVSKAKFKKYFKVNAKAGKITVKKGLKKGKYTVKIKVSASGNGNYLPAAKTVKAILKVR